MHEQKHFPFSTTCTYISASLDAAFVSDVVTNMVVLSFGTQARCLTTARRWQSSGTTAGTLVGTLMQDRLGRLGGLGRDES